MKSQKITRVNMINLRLTRMTETRFMGTIVGFNSVMNGRLMLAVSKTKYQIIDCSYIYVVDVREIHYTARNTELYKCGIVKYHSNYLFT